MKQQTEAPKSAVLTRFERTWANINAGLKAGRNKPKTAELMAVIERSPMLREVIERDREAAIAKRREIMSANDLERASAYSRLELANAHRDKAQVEFTAIEKSYKEALATLEAAQSEAYGSHNRYQRYASTSATAARELIDLADPRIKDLRAWIAGLDDAVRLSCGEVRRKTTMTFAGPKLERIWNTHEVAVARDQLRTLLGECDLILTGDYGIDVRQRLIDLRDQAMRTIEPFLEYDSDRFTFHEVGE